MLNNVRPELIYFLLFLAAIWVFSIFLVAWDARRRQLPARWIILSLIPFAGALAYLAGRLRRPAPSRRVTALKPPEMEVARRQPAAKRMPTVLAADLLRQEQPQPAARGLAPTAHTLVAEEGPYQGQRFALTSLPVRIGRDLDCALRLDDDHGVSRHHAELYRQNGQLRIKDLNSTHGTFVNGRQVQDAELAPGDTLKLGHSYLTLHG
jgi:hypothetical protein